jgi:predicted dehydrogenase
VNAGIDIYLPRAEQMAAKLSAATGEPCAAFSSLADALAGDVEIDAVDLMLLHNQHEAAALEAFSAGLHVMLEKPMSITPESCGRVVAAARATDKVFWIAEQAQYSPSVLTAQGLISEGAIGQTLALHTMGGTGRPASMSSFKTMGEATAGGDGMPVKPKQSRGQGSVIAKAGLPADDLRVPLGKPSLHSLVANWDCAHKLLVHSKRERPPSVQTG